MLLKGQCRWILKEGVLVVFFLLFVTGAWLSDVKIVVFTNSWCKSIITTVTIVWNDFGVDGWVAEEDGAIVCFDYLPDGDSKIYLLKELAILIEINMGGPLMCNSEQQFGEQVET